MEIFYSNNIGDSVIKLDKEESGHCIKVLRHRIGDEISVIDGFGGLYTCRLIDDNPKEAVCSIVNKVFGFGAHPYNLSMAVCPTKNIERYEWFVEKATELGIDKIIPVIGDHSERKVVKTERLSRIVLSAVKQSLKSIIPEIAAPCSVYDVLDEDFDYKFICCCFEPEGGRKTIQEFNLPQGAKICILIGPEGDFSKEELTQALQKSWIPISLGDSRLRTETAALTAVTAVYLTYTSPLSRP